MLRKRREAGGKGTFPFSKGREKPLEGETGRRWEVKGKEGEKKESGRRKRSR